MINKCKRLHRSLAFVCELYDHFTGLLHVCVCQYRIRIAEFRIVCLGEPLWHLLLQVFFLK